MPAQVAAHKPHLVAQSAAVLGAGVGRAGGQLLRSERRKDLAGGLSSCQLLQKAGALVEGSPLRQLVCRIELGRITINEVLEAFEKCGCWCTRGTGLEKTRPKGQEEDCRLLEQPSFI